jgi:hypothetical protein
MKTSNIQIEEMMETLERIAQSDNYVLGKKS